MKASKWIAAAWIGGVTLPALAATVFLVGCCMLPFHGLIHKVMPLCETAAHMMRGEHGEDHHDAQPVPVPEKQEPVKRVVKLLLPVQNSAAMTVDVRSPSPATTPAAYRSFITLGAARCDDDIGAWLASLNTLRI